MFTVPRKCREIGGGESSLPPQSLGDFRENPAYVLLGEPGAGKTTAFKDETESEETFCLIPARDFLDFDKNSEWQGKTLFIDGLDEISAGETGLQTPLGAIRGKLDKLETPKFRLSCRAADWLGPSDGHDLDALLPNNEEIPVLRLEPLSPEDVREVLEKRLHVANPEEFIESARQKELESLLDNPQNLEMLALAVEQSGGQWPEDRKRAFDLACEKLLEERNPDHSGRRRRSASAPDLLMAAGKLFSIQILTGHAGYSLDNDESSGAYLPLNRVSHGNRSEFDDVIDSRLFRVPQENRAEPHHRHVAEFLGAKYLAERITKRLPVERILALTTGFDGGVVSEFRGLLAWLATHSLTGREKLLERDPCGIVAHGHIRNFSVDHKTRLLKALRHEAETNPWFEDAFSRDLHWEGFATPDMKEELLKHFKVSEPDDAQQSLALICLQAIDSGSGISGMSDFALGILENPRWGLPARRAALNLFIHQTEDNEDGSSKLTNLLEAAEAGNIFDPADDLCGRLLEAIYPQALSPAEAVRFLRPPKRGNYYGAYCRFWTRTITEKSRTEQLGELLDFLVKLSEQSPGKFSRNFDQFNHLRHLPERWLERYLEDLAGEPDPRRLLDWLEMIRASTVNPDYEKIGEWLSGHPEALLEVYGLGMDQCANSDRFNLCVSNAKRRLAGAMPPEDFGIWCLERAVTAEHPEIARHLVRSMANCMRDNYCNAGLSPETVENRLSEKPDLLEIYAEHRDSTSSDDAELEQHREEYNSDLLERRKEWHSQLQSMKEDLLANRCRRDVLHELAVAYYGGYRDVSGDTPKERLASLLGRDENLIEGVLQAFRMSIDREDLPSVEEVFRLEANNETPLLSYPYMAGLNEISKTSRDGSLPISKEQVRLALAFYYTVPLWPLAPRTNDETPRWFPSLLQSQPDMVSDILVAAAREKLRHSSDLIKGPYELAHSPDYEEVARMASLPLLKAFPVRCSGQRLQDLNLLLTAAVLHCEKKDLLKIAEEKLSSQTMHVGQRVRWLAAGLFAAPEQYRDKLESYVVGDESRIRDLAGIMTSRFLEAFPDPPDVSVLSLLIRLLGSSYGPYRYDDEGSSMKSFRVALGMDAAHSIRFFCEQLAKIPTAEATESLRLLKEEEALRAWHPNLTDLAYKQRILRRDNNFEHRTVDEVFRTLENARPANPADLAAVAMMKLRETAEDIRDGNTSDWKAYWTEKEGEMAPQHEDFCRDRLLSKLRPLLTPLEIDAQPEGHYVNNKRSDIRFSCNGFNVPVEIKKSNHRDLWSAIRNQLKKNYARDPKADGYGIYVVLWFGEEFCKIAESGLRPGNPERLEQDLFGTLSEEERNKIRICVVDVSRQS